MDTELPQKFPFILDRNLAKANCTEDRVCTSCDKVVLGIGLSCRIEAAAICMDQRGAMSTLLGAWARVDSSTFRGYWRQKT